MTGMYFDRPVVVPPLPEGPLALQLVLEVGCHGSVTIGVMEPEFRFSGPAVLTGLPVLTCFTGQGILQRTNAE